MDTSYRDTYITIEKASEGLYKDKGSKFLSFAYPVHNEDEANEFIASLRKKYFDARHHCFAWRLGGEGEHTRAYDDGEPSSTAGRPILGQILSNQLTNILIVVVRYFGGTKLGTSGLIQAYKAAAADAIQNNSIIEKTIDIPMTIRFPYEKMTEVMKIIKNISPKITRQYIDNFCTIELSVRKASYSPLNKLLGEISDIQIESHLKKQSIK